MKNKSLIISLIVTVLFATLFVWGFQMWSNQAKPVASINRLSSLEQMEKDGLPIFSFEDMSGSKVEFNSAKEKVRIVNFWASWCEPCLAEIPSLVELMNAFPDQIELYAISGDNSLDDINAFLKSFPGMKQKNIHIFLDKDQKIMSLYGTDRLPESYISDKQGRLVKKIVGSINWHTKESEAYIRVILEKK